MALQEEFENQGNYLFKYRGTLPLIILFVGVLVYSHDVFYGLSIQNDDWINTYKYSCLACSLLGLLIRILTVGYTPRNTSGRNTENQIADELNTTGIYSTVRHPLYVGNFFMWLGAGMYTQNFWFVVSFVFIYWVYYERIMFAEEQFLRRKFGQQYLDWAAGVPAFIPLLTKWSKPKLWFSWKKVLRQEKNGLVAVLLILYVFELIGQTIQNNALVITYDFWFWGMVFGVISYLILKFLKHQTSLLNEENR